MAKKTTPSQTFTLDQIRQAFETLYNIMETENADPGQMCYAATSVETDLVNILSGELLPDGTRKSSGRKPPTMTKIDDLVQPFFGR